MYICQCLLEKLYMVCVFESSYDAREQSHVRPH